MGRGMLNFKTKNKIWSLFKKYILYFLNLTEEILQENNKIYTKCDKKYILFLQKRHDSKHLNHLELLINKYKSYSNINNNQKTFWKKVYNEFYKIKYKLYYTIFYFFKSLEVY